MGDDVRSVVLLCLTVLACLFTSSARAEKRVALVIGISNYQQVPRLTNPTRDAEVVSGLFKKAGFDVVQSQRDLGIAELRRAVRDFAATATNADIAVVYYAGHGIEVDGTNYLIPNDAKLLSDFDIEDETISLDRVMRSLDQAKRLKLVILDACRDNPFSKTMKRSVASRSIGRGLAKVEPTQSDTLIAFAAKAGAVASDGDGSNSPFAAALVRHIAEPGLDLRIAFGRVRDDVLKSTANRQEPFVYGSLGGDTVSLVPPAAKPAVDPEATTRVDYELAAQVGTREAWDSFLAAHQSGLYADLARAQKNKLIAAEQSRLKADETRARAEQQAAAKAEELRRQLEEQAAKQTAEAKQKLSEQAKRELEEARRQYAEQVRKELEAAKEQARLSQQQAEAAQAQVEEVRRKAAAEAQAQAEQARRDRSGEKVAALTPTEPAAAAPSFQMDPVDLARLLQAHLKRVGCNPGNTDGKWDDSSSKALDSFNRNARTTFNVKLASLDALEGVRGKTERVCPLVCPKGQRVDGERCVQIGCSAGFALNAAGECEKRPEPAVKPRTVQQEPAPRRTAPAGGGGAKCFTFNGRSYCE